MAWALLGVRWYLRVCYFILFYWSIVAFPVVKKNKKQLPATAREPRDMGSIPGSGRSSGVGNGNPLQYSCLENSMDRGAWWAIVHGVAKNQA